jgi:GNAT superfamily N-acetyltransferase
MGAIAISEARSDAELEVYVERWNALTPGEASLEQQRARRAREPRRLHLLAELDGAPAGCGFAGPSDSPGRGFLAPRVLPATRGNGVGTALLGGLGEHLSSLGFETASSHVDGADGASLAFAERHGFFEVDRQVEQVKTLGDEEPSPPPPGLRFVTVAERRQLLREVYDLACEGYEDLATVDPVVVSLDEWLAEEATIPEGSFVALAGEKIVGYTGLCRAPGGSAEDGLTVVGRAWRRRGLALALKRAKLAWAASSGIAEIVTWTQRGNDGMRSVNERLGYVYRDVIVSVQAPLPFRRP